MNPSTESPPLFASLPRKYADVLSHWYALVPNFQASAQEFYADIEKELKEREIPGLAISRVEFSEGGTLSAKRMYLRLERERLVFDICAAPFGSKAYFFSCRFAEIPAVIRPWEVAVALFAFALLYFLFYHFLGFLLGSFLLVAAIGFTLWLLRNAVSLGLADIDSALMRTPIAGPLYERFLRKETYYRHDTRIMYLDSVSDLVKKRVGEVTGSGGIKLVSVKEFNPILGGLYRPTPIPPSEGTAPA